MMLLWQLVQRLKRALQPRSRWEWGEGQRRAGRTGRSVAFWCKSLLAGLACSLPLASQAVGKVVTVGTLAYGTLNWELAVIEYQALDRRYGFGLTLYKLASPQAGQIALQAGSVDLIVTDWLWVAKQRSRGADFTAVPYSLTHGALVVAPNSPIRSLQELAGKRIGIAGGALDKNWLLLQALTLRQYDLDLARVSQPVFGAPPLLNQQLLQGRLDALLTYWNYAAPLEARGYQRLLTGADLLQALGISPPIPTLGYVFRERWSNQAPETIHAFLKAVFEAKEAICSDPEVWRHIAPRSGSDDPKVQAVLHQRYCQGRLRRWGEEELRAADRLYRLLGQIGGERLTGPATELPKGTFWPQFTWPR